MKIEKMDSKKAREALHATEKRVVTVNERIDAIQPPAKPMGATGPTPIGAPAFDPLASAGPEYRTCVDDGDPKALAALVREHEELVAERVMLYARRDKLTSRLRQATEEEARAAAPGAAKRLLSELPADLDDADGLLAALAAKLDEISEKRRQADAARALLDHGAPYYSPTLLRRLWALDAGAITADRLRKTISTRHDALPVVVEAVGGGRTVRADYRNDCERKLLPPSMDGASRERIEQRFRGDPLAEHRIQQAETQWRRDHAAARARELAGALD